MSKKNRGPSIIVILILGLTLTGSGIFVVLKILESRKPTVKPASQYMKENFNVKEYFEENSVIKSVASADKSSKPVSEIDAIAELRDRGFKDYPVTTNYSIKGEYTSSQSISDTSAKKHPVYETYYVTSKDEVWIITMIDGTVMATPSSYNVEHNEKVAIVVSESNEIVSYDGNTNSFYRTIPNSSVLDVRVVGKIDAGTLETMDLEG